MLLEDVKKPGAYVCLGSGDLIRVTGTGGVPDDMPSLQNCDPKTVSVTRISIDPFVSITQARMTAANLDIEINF